MSIPLPLHCYDEAGVVLPPAWWYGFLAFGARDVLLVLLISALPEEADTLFKLVFVHSNWLVWQLLVAVPFLLVFVLTSFRARLWQKQKVNWRRWLKPLCWVGIVSQLLAVSMFILKTGGQFNVYYASIFIGLSIMAYMLAKSRHVNIMIEDWQFLPGVKTGQTSK